MQGGQSRWLGDTTILAAMLSRSFLSVPSVPSAVKSTTGNQGPGGTGPYPIPRPPSQPKTSWDETSQPPSRPSITSGLETSRLHTFRALATQNFLGRDVPAPIQTLHYLGPRDVPSPHLPRPHNARHQSGTSPARPQPVFKTLKGFQTVAGGKAARPPPPVPCPQNSSPLRLRRGLGVAASPRLRNPSVPMLRDSTATKESS